MRPGGLALFCEDFVFFLVFRLKNPLKTSILIEWLFSDKPTTIEEFTP